MPKPIICTSSYLRTTTTTKGIAKALISALEKLDVEHMELTHTNDYWCRDYMPVYLFEDGYSLYEYRPDYLWDKVKKRKYITRQNEVCKGLDLFIPTNMQIVFDGGNYVRCDNKVIMTDKVFMENPQWPTHLLIQHLHEVLCADIIFLPWDMNEPFGHSDGMVANLGNGRLLINNYSQTIKKYEIPYYERLLKILQPHFEIVELTYDCKPERDSWCYLNYLRVPNGILLPCLSENALCDNDQAALETFGKLFPDKQIIPIYAKPLLKHGGALHCVTWEYYRNDRQYDCRKII